MILLLIGFIGSGKSSTGRMIAKEMDKTFVEMDAEVLLETGMPSVQDVYKVRLSLWDECELQVCKKLSNQDDTVIACSGDIVENDLNFQYFKENAPNKFKTVYLHASPEVLAKRIISSHPDAKMQDEDKIISNIKSFFDKRDTLYKMHADLTIHTEGKTINEVSQMIIDYLQA